MIVRPNPTQPGKPTRVPQPPAKPSGRIPDARRDGTVKDIKPPQTRDGRPISQRPLENRNGRVIAPTHNNITIINNNTYITNIHNVQNNWNSGDHRYGWYDWGGHHVCHHYDSWGYHWWGWYIGDYYFWTRYYNDYYWWYDPYWHRWCYMHDGRWWWRDPYHVEVVYVYSDNGYYRYQDSSGGVVMQPDPTPPADVPPPSEDPAPAPAPDTRIFTSQDGTRSVTISADGKLSAFLNDTAETPAFQPVWLGDGVTDVRFKNNQDGSLNEVLTITNDGSFGIFDKDGYAVNAAVAAPPAAGESAFNEGETSSAGSSLQKSAMFGALQTGSVNW